MASENKVGGGPSTPHSQRVFHDVRNIHELFQAKMLEKAHGYCIEALQMQLNSP
jgi:hypothetical protein